MKWWLYNVLFAVGYALMMPRFVSRMRRRGGYRADFGQRFGRFSARTAAALAERPRIWVHAVSVGEANLAGSILRELRRRLPDASFVISTTSSTGRGVCEKLAGPGDVVIYLPVDFPCFVRRALRTIPVRALILTESEFWPNLIRALNRRNVPIVLVNGRVSDRSAPRYRAMRMFFADVFACFSALLVQSETDRGRLLAAGAPAGRIRVMGSVKFDVPELTDGARIQAREALLSAGLDPERDLVLLGGSTWPGEERALVCAWRQARRLAPNLRLVLVPRHMERGDAIARELAEAGLSCVRRSRKAACGEEQADADTVLLVDTTGELFALYAEADIVFVGKTLAPHVGGQNMIEPAAFGQAVLCGPHTENFAGVMACFRADGAIREVADADGLAAAVAELAANEGVRRGLGARAQAVVLRERGALARSAQAIVDTLTTC